MPELENKKHELFCREFLVDLNATAAYKRVYVNCKSDGAARVESTKLNARENVKERVAELFKSRANKVELTSDDVLRDILEIKDRCMQKEAVMEFNKEEKKMVPTGEWQFKETGALKACELIGKHLGMWDKKSMEKLGETFEDAVRRLSGDSDE